MNTPVADFVRAYGQGQGVRFHMPGHKGQSFLGCEGWDITEIGGADVLYEDEGILGESQKNATKLFGTGRTCYAAGGSSQCVKAMLRLALLNRPEGSEPLILAARNVHKSFVFAAALLGFETEWLYPRERLSLCSCPIEPGDLEKTLQTLPKVPAAVYVTSPDYLGHEADIEGLAQVCHGYGTRLLVDNAHGAYLHFLPVPRHPMDLGADLCCDSAHKTLPVLTGGAYLHCRKGLESVFGADMPEALSLFGSTSPSYLTLASLDLCNAYLEGYGERLKSWIRELDALKARLEALGWGVEKSDPLRLTLRAEEGGTGYALCQRLREQGMECEYADEEFLVLMTTPENGAAALYKLEKALGKAEKPPKKARPLPILKPKRLLSMREALLSPHETLPLEAALGRICAAPTVSCPPAVPLIVSGEMADEETLAACRRYGIDRLEVVKA